MYIIWLITKKKSRKESALRVFRCAILTTVVNVCVQTLDKIQDALYNKALERRNELTYECTSLEEVEKIMNEKPGFVKAMWCGDEECELKMKEIKGTKSRCILENEKHIHDKCIVCGTTRGDDARLKKFGLEPGCSYNLLYASLILSLYSWNSWTV